jgi:hypothetical protein
MQMLAAKAMSMAFFVGRCKQARSPIQMQGKSFLARKTVQSRTIGRASGWYFDSLLFWGFGAAAAVGNLALQLPAVLASERVHIVYIVDRSGHQFRGKVLNFSGATRRIRTDDLLITRVRFEFNADW